MRDGDKKGEERAFSFSWACPGAQRGLITLSGPVNAGSHRPGLLFTIKQLDNKTHAMESAQASAAGSRSRTTFIPLLFMLSHFVLRRKVISGL